MYSLFMEKLHARWDLLTSTSIMAINHYQCIYNNMISAAMKEKEGKTIH